MLAKNERGAYIRMKLSVRKKNIAKKTRAKHETASTLKTNAAKRRFQTKGSLFQTP
jgi:hypothetical protein